MGRIATEIRKPAKLLPKWLEQPGMVGIRLTFMREQAAHADQRRDRTGSGRPPEKARIPVMFFAPDNMPEDSRRSPSAIRGCR